MATVWDALKAFNGRRSRAYSSQKKKDKKKKVPLLEKEIGQFEKILSEQYNEECFRKICQLKCKIHEIYNKKYSLFSVFSLFYEVFKNVYEDLYTCTCSASGEDL